MSFCPKCGTENKAENLFCSACGYSFASRNTEAVEIPDSYDSTTQSATEPSYSQPISTIPAEGTSVAPASVLLPQVNVAEKYKKGISFCVAGLIILLSGWAINEILSNVTSTVIYSIFSNYTLGNIFSIVNLIFSDLFIIVGSVFLFVAASNFSLINNSAKILLILAGILALVPVLNSVITLVIPIILRKTSLPYQFYNIFYLVVGSLSIIIKSLGFVMAILGIAKAKR